VLLAYCVLHKSVCEAKYSIPAEEKVIVVQPSYSYVVQYESSTMCKVKTGISLECCLFYGN